MLLLLLWKLDVMLIGDLPIGYICSLNLMSFLAIFTEFDDGDDIDTESDDDINRSSDEYKTFHGHDIEWKWPHKLTEGIEPQTASTSRVSRVKGKENLKVPTKRKRTIQKVEEVKHELNKLKSRSCVRGLRALPTRVEEVFVKIRRSDARVINCILGLRAPNAPGLRALSARVEEVVVKKPRS
ncbi:hypothetical protein Tco_0749830 [Tanacetum coccineum]|uniref:Uncharacterized protein n=1 Tax=Tanacetum coccineum TaxID=301880 RepID=A0ABQ4YZI7_9ASTR